MWLIKVFEGFYVVKQIVEKDKDVAEMIADGLKSLGYEARIYTI